MNYDLEKIRSACLELMGWRSTSYIDGASTYTHWHADASVKLDRQDSTQFPPDPTCSLDDALPLMEKYGIRLGPPFTYERKWEAYSPNHAIECFDESPALAVCLCAIRCAGRILEDFEVTP